MKPSHPRAHPWHGVSPGPDAPAVVTCYIEIVPTDTVKYEVDKETGILKIDRPQLYSNVCPTLYGFIPRTYCGENIARLCERRTGKTGIKGDGDPIDICILSENKISHGDILVQAVPIGGLRLLDKNEADDKIIAVLKKDAMYGDWKDIADCPESLLDRLKHYFLTYKRAPDGSGTKMEIAEVYGAEDAAETIRMSLLDYVENYGSGE